MPSTSLPPRSNSGALEAAVLVDGDRQFEAADHDGVPLNGRALRREKPNSSEQDNRTVSTLPWIAPKEYPSYAFRWRLWSAQPVSLTFVIGGEDQEQTTWCDVAL